MTGRTLVIASALLFGVSPTLLAASPAAQHPPSCAVGRERLSVKGATELNYLGYAMAMEDDTLFVGAPLADGPAGEAQGAVILFRRDGAAWSEAEHLVGSDSAASSLFGRALAVDGQRLVVGSPFHTVNGLSGAGSAYVFERTGSRWTEQAVLTDLQPGASESFGISVAVDRDRIAVGARLDDDAASQGGSVTVFELVGGTWTATAELYAGDPQQFGLFGHALELQGRTLMASAPEADTGFDTGVIYVFEGAGSAWTQVARLVPDVVGYDQFAWGFDLDGDRMAAGCRYTTPGSVSLAGAAYVFERQGAQWTQTAALTPAAPNPFELFGFGVELRENVLLVGAITATHAAPEAGAAYYFALENGTWSERQLLLPWDAVGEETFGRSFAWDAGTLFVSADYLAAPSQSQPPGAVYVLDWLQAPASYCVGKTNSDGCVPFLTVSGTPSVSSTQPFRIEGRDVLDGEFGILLYSRRPAELDFHGGVLCVKAPVQRLLPPKLAKALGVPPCRGVLKRDFNATIQSSFDPSLTVGRAVHAQWFQRDASDPAGFGDGLTDAVRFTICP